ncbi:MAG TPA: hypothetical protein VKG25_18495 [Bryobacteraceae bacterium]|nr:hypothetical protein [Bryobacteraceae bacterium]
MSLSDREIAAIYPGEEAFVALPASQRSSPVSDFFKHPAVLLVLGFVCTGLVGAGVADYWKARDWENQQNYLFAQRFLQKQYELVDDLVKAVAETNTAAEDVLILYTSQWPQKEIDERKKAWSTTSIGWRIKSKILQQRLNIYFRNPAVLASFERIVNMRKRVGVTITAFGTSGFTPADRPELNEAQQLINEIKDELLRCGTLMAQELVSQKPR